MFLGVFLYLLNEYFKKYNITKRTKILLTAAEVLCLSLPILTTYFAWKSVQRLNLLSLVIGAGIMLSQRSYTTRIPGGIITFLGKLSMPLYIFHWAVGTAVVMFYSAGTLYQKFALYYCASIFVAAIAYFTVEYCKEKLKTSNWKHKFFSVEKQQNGQMTAKHVKIS